MTPAKSRILFVEDHDDTRELISLVLQQSDYEVAAVATLRETLKLAKGGNFNLFIFDSWLADGSGVDLCKQVREFDRRTPILFYSGVAQEKEINLALNAGAQAYLVKPVEVPQLLQAVADLLTPSAKSEPQFRTVNSGDLAFASTAL